MTEAVKYTHPVLIKVMNHVQVFRMGASFIKVFRDGQEVLCDVCELATMRDLERSGIAVNILVSWFHLIRLHLDYVLA